MVFTPKLAARERLIVALDVSSAGKARALTNALAGVVSTFKVGKQLFTSEGPQLVRDLGRAGQKVFLDLKFHDIPNTVSAAVRAAAGLGVSMLTVHASGGINMLRAAVTAAREVENPPLVLAVTVLTSMSDQDVQEIGFSGTVQDQVLRLAALALNAGCGGIVASARDAREVRRQLGSGFVMVTPGVRPAGSESGDQVRVVTPAEAIAAGATHIVVGRPITGAADPDAAVKAILADLKTV